MADLPLDQLPEKISPEAEDLLYLVDSAAPQGAGDAKVKVGSLPQPVTDHGALTGLADDDHPQYHTDARGDARYDPIGAGIAAVEAHEAALDPHAAAAYLQSVVAGTNVTVDDTDPRNPVVSATGGETDHGALTGLTDDDHPQYHTDARGDARYDPIGAGIAAVEAHETLLDPHAAAGYLQSVVAGTNVTVDDTDPRNPVVSATGGETDHGALTGLTDDDHPQYLNEARGDVLYDPLGAGIAAVGAHETLLDPHAAAGYLQSVVAGTNVTVDDTDPRNPVVSATASGGETDHGALTGLADNDHLQYLQSVVAGTNVSVDAADSQNPVVSATGIQEGADNEVAGVKVSVVAALPGTPDADTLYFVTG